MDLVTDMIRLPGGSLSSSVLSVGPDMGGGTMTVRQGTPQKRSRNGTFGGREGIYTWGSVRGGSDASFMLMF